MSRSTMLCLLLILTLAFIVSCSGGSENLITPETGGTDVATAEGTGTTVCLGLWQFVADKATGNVDLVQLRNADMIINVLGFMEPPPLTSMDLDWADLFIDFPNNHIDVGVILKHPIPDDVFTGFDVRGVCFGPVVENADGLTIIPGPEYFSGVPFGYVDGALGAPDSYGDYEGLAGYKYFCEGLGEDEVLSDFFSDPGDLADRGKFGAGANVQRNYSLDWNDTGYDILVFNYAIYANYDWPNGDAPWDIDDWDISTANSAEAFCCKVTELANSLYYATGSGGGNISLQIEAWDWQGDISRVTIESGGVIAQADYDVALGAFPNGYSYGFEFYAVPGTPTEIGNLDILITVTDVKTFGECWFLDLLPTSNSMYDEKVYNCFIHTTTVIDCPAPTVTSIDPTGGLKGAVIDDAEITGTFMDGSLLAVALKKTGETDITCTDVTFVDTNTITCDIPLDDAAVGVWDVEVTNGCGTPGTLAAGFTVAPSKNIALRSGVTTRDIAVDHADGDLLVLYIDGQVWRYTEGGFYQDGALFYNSSTAAYFIDISPNSCSIVGGGPTVGGPLYLRSFNAAGSALYSHTCPRFVMEVVGYTCPTYLNTHASLKGWFTTSWDYWYDRHSPPNYSGGSGNLYYNNYGAGAITASLVKGLECSTQNYIYCLEGGPEYRVECKSTTCSSSSGYTNWGGTQSDGMGGFNDPKDLTRDDNNDYYILDLLSTNQPLIKKYSSYGSQIGSFGDSTGISGSPLRIEGSDYNPYIFVLHSSGLSIYFPSEM